MRTTGIQDRFYDTNKYKEAKISAKIYLATKLNPKLTICS